MTNIFLLNTWEHYQMPLKHRKRKCSFINSSVEQRKSEKGTYIT
jgi:hypothetical protein